MRWYFLFLLFITYGFAEIVFEPVCPLLSKNGFITPQVKAGIIDEEFTCYNTKVYFKIGNSTYELSKTGGCVFKDYVPAKDIQGEYIANISGVIKKKTCLVLSGNLEIKILWPKENATYYLGDVIQVSAMLLLNQEPINGNLTVDGIKLQPNYLGIYTGEVNAKQNVLVFKGEYLGVTVEKRIHINIQTKKNTSIQTSSLEITLLNPKENQTLYLGQTVLFRMLIKENGLISSEKAFIILGNDTIELNQDMYGVYYREITIPNTTEIKLRINNSVIKLPLHIEKREDVDIVKSGIRLKLLPLPNSSQTNKTLFFSMRFEDLYGNTLFGNVKIKVLLNNTELCSLIPTRHLYLYQSTFVPEKPGNYTFKIFFNNTEVRTISVLVQRKTETQQPLKIRILSPKPSTYELKPMNVYVQLLKDDVPVNNAIVTITDNNTEIRMKPQGNGKYFAVIEPNYGINEYTIVAKKGNLTGIKLLTFSTSTKYLEIKPDIPVEKNISQGEPLEIRVKVTSENTTIPNAYVTIKIVEPSGRSIEAIAYETDVPGEYYTLFYPNTEGDYYITLHAEKEGYIPAEETVISTVRFPEEKIIITKNTLLSIILILALISLGYVVLKALF